MSNWGGKNVSTMSSFGSFGSFGNFGQAAADKKDSQNGGNNGSVAPEKSDTFPVMAPPPGLQRVVKKSGADAGSGSGTPGAGNNDSNSNSNTTNNSISHTNSHTNNNSNSNTGNSSNSGTGAPTSGAAVPEIERFGLKGLNSILRNPDSQLAKVALGSDLLMMDQNLETMLPDDQLLETFQSPWNETSVKDVEPVYELPESVKELNKSKHTFLQPAENRISSYPEETLFFIFYSKPKDILQELAARELKERNWRFHKVLKLWLAKVKDYEPVQETPLSERGFYTFFDPQTWQKVTKEYVLEYSAIL